MQRTVLIDPEAVAVTVRLFAEAGQIVEVRALEAMLPGQYRPGTVSGYFDDFEALANAVSKITAALGIYFVLNPPNPALLARARNRLRLIHKEPTTSDHDILYRRWLPIDADPVRPAGISSNEEEHHLGIEAVRRINAELKCEGWPAGIVADSGNGGHLDLRIDVPTNDGGLVERVLKSMQNRFGNARVKIDETLFNPARILRLYGSRACKGDNVSDRPHRISKILDVPPTREPVPRELLEEFVATWNATKNTVSVAIPRAFNRNFNIDRWIRDHNLQVSGPEPWQGGRRWVFDTCLWNADHTNRSAFIIERPDGKLGAGCRHNGCKGKGWRELRNIVEPGWRDHGQSKSAAIPRIEGVATRRLEPIPRYIQFPVDTLPDPIGGFVTAGAKAIGCDSSYISLPLLAALATAIGNTRRIQLKKSWLAPPILWSAIVGESGTSKTPAFALAMRPLKERQNRAMEAFQEAAQSYTTDRAYFEREYSQWKKSKSETEPPEEPTEPLAERYIVSDVTVEALAPLLLANPRGLLMCRDELAGWLGSFDRYAGGNSRVGADAANWLSMFNAEGFVVDRKTGKPPTMFVPQAAVCIAGGIQPSILHKALGSVHRESGLAARLLLACPPRRPKRWTDADVAASATRDVTRIFDRLYALQCAVDDEGRQQPIAIALTSEARAEWIAYYSAHNLEQLELSGEMSAAWSKLEEYAARLALVIHCLRWAAGEAPATADAIDVETMSAAVRLTEWFKLKARRVYSLLGETPEEGDRRRLVEWLERRGGAATARETQQGCRWLATAQEAEAALEELVKTGQACWELSPSGQRGQPTRRCVLLTTVYGNSAKPAENTNTVDVDNVDASEIDPDEGDWGEV